MRERRLLSLFRHPVKGLHPEAMDLGILEAGGGLQGDRAFAFQFMDEAVPAELRAAPAESAPWMIKFHLANQHDWPDLAKIVPRWSGATLSLEATEAGGGPSRVEADVRTPAGRESLARFVEEFLSRHKPFERARHPQLAPLRLIGAAEQGTRYTDGERGPVSIVLSESIEDLAKRFGFAVDARRFRINLHLQGAPAWNELGWLGRRLRIGACILQITKPIGRCPNIDVDPDSAERKDEIFPQLKAMMGHPYAGVRADVIQGGEIRPGDSWELMGENLEEKS